MKDHPDHKIATDVSAMFPELTARVRFGNDEPRVNEIVAEALYWRKANAIHAWFVKNVQNDVDDCGNYYVDRDQLQALRDLCKEVLADQSKASELLPSQSGFFFGGVDYDEWYFADLERTVKEIDEVLAWPADWEFEYHSSW
jgi:hypothetical protein